MSVLPNHSVAIRGHSTERPPAFLGGPSGPTFDRWGIDGFDGFDSFGGGGE